MGPTCHLSHIKLTDGKIFHHFSSKVSTDLPSSFELEWTTPESASGLSTPKNDTKYEFLVLA